MADQNVTDDRVITRGPAYLLGAVVTPTGGAASAALFRDGVNSGAPLRATLRSFISVSTPFTFPEPMYFEHGIFISVSAGTTEALVFYEPVREEDVNPAAVAPPP